MKRSFNLITWPKWLFALSLGAMTLLVDLPSLSQGEFAVSTAQARIGRPATPLSYAGVARRTTRRAVAVGTAAAVAAPRCVRVVDAYGRMVTRCY